ncbi:SA1362 family protein [Neobacillus sp. SM06]|uniref:SA1362 family protein n=1 Tax=Neobacillus sp. SM06 TaxID=3422492 RepID=UPI003D2B73AD
MKNRTSNLLVAGLLILALIGITGMFIGNPIGFLQKIAVMGFIVAAIYFVVRLIFKANPQKKEQRAFLKAARQSKKRLQKRGGESPMRNPFSGTLAPLKKSSKTKKKTPAHLTVIDGKKSKKKNRASF